MDIAALSVGMSQLKLSSAVQVSVLKLAMNSANENSAQMTEMMKMASDPNLGTNLDVKA